jgi:hypothetical protein
LYLNENYKPYRYFCVLFMNTKTKGKLRLKKGIFKIRVGKFYDSHLATLYLTVNAGPGFTQEAFDALENKADRSLIVNLTVNEMAILEHLHWSGNSIRVSRKF